MQDAFSANLTPACHELLVQRVELIGIFRKCAACHELFEPVPLRYRRFDEARRRIGVILKQLRRSSAIIG